MPWLHSLEIWWIHQCLTSWLSHGQVHCGIRRSQGSSVWKFEVRKRSLPNRAPCYTLVDSKENVFQHAVNRSRCLFQGPALAGDRSERPPNSRPIFQIPWYRNHINLNVLPLSTKHSICISSIWLKQGLPRKIAPKVVPLWSSTAFTAVPFGRGTASSSSCRRGSGGSTSRDCMKYGQISFGWTLKNGTYMDGPYHQWAPKRMVCNLELILIKKVRWKWMKTDITGPWLRKFPKHPCLSPGDCFREPRSTHLGLGEVTVTAFGMVYSTDNPLIHVCMYVCMYVCMCMYTNIYIYTYIHIYMYMYIYIYICICIYIYICIYVCIYIYVWVRSLDSHAPSPPNGMAP